MNNRKNSSTVLKPVERTCARCAGLPWRRGGKIGDFCPRCRRPYADEELPSIEEYIVQKDDIMNGS